MKLVLLLLILLSWIQHPCHGLGCGTLNLVRLNSTNPRAVCADNTIPGYYFAPALSSSKKWIITLGDGEICGSASNCESILSRAVPFNQSKEDEFCDVAYGDENTKFRFNTSLSCHFNRLPFTSSYLSRYQELEAGTILCSAKFGTFNRVFIPMCTLDWFLGNGSSILSDNATFFQGSTVLSAILQELSTTHSLNTASQIVLAGSFGGGVAVMNSFSRVKTLFPAANVIGVVDSAWIVNQERFGHRGNSSEVLNQPLNIIDKELEDRSKNWISRSLLDPKCKSRLQGSALHRCFYGQELFTLQNSLIKESIFVIQSQYDLLMLAGLDVLDTSLISRFSNDSRSFANAAAQFVEGFGAVQRTNFERASLPQVNQAPGDKTVFFSSACLVHGYIVPTAAQEITRTEISLGDAGFLEIFSDGTAFNTTESGPSGSRLVLEDAILTYINSNGSATSFSGLQRRVIADNCTGVLCNPTCTTTLIRPFVVETSLSTCSTSLIVTYVLIAIGFFWLVFLAAIVNIVMFRRTVRSYWSKVKYVESKSLKTGGNVAGTQQAKLREEAMEEVVRETITSAKTLSLMCKDLGYIAPPRRRGMNPTPILKDVTISFPHSKVHALMGPSGSGKSTLLDVIALTRDSGEMTGLHYINGVASHLRSCNFLKEWLRHNVSFVKQQDELFPRLTVREHLTHAAWLVLPEFMNSNDKLRRVWRVIKLLELESCADTICGDGGVAILGGISGGQRRRVSVATQLINMPACLLLDEPTSGLDSTNALLLVRTLHTLAQNAKMNVLLTIHQPRTEIYEFLDSLTILVAGRIVFHGKPSEAFGFFKVSKETNIGNEILDQLASISANQLMEMHTKFMQGELGRRMIDSMVSEVELNFSNDSAFQLRAALVANALADGRWSWTESSGVPHFMWVLLSRTIARGGFDIQKTISISLAGGILVGILFLQPTTFSSKTAVLYLSCLTMTFFQGTFLGDRYWAEKFMYDFERDAGTARPWLSFLLSMYSRLFVSCTLESLAFAIPVFFLSKMNPEAFEMFLIIMVMIGLTTATQYLLVEIRFMRPDDKRTGALVNMVLLSAAALFNGFIIQLPDLPVYLQWVPYIMLSFWGFVALIVNDFRGFTFDNCAQFFSQLECAARTGDNVIRNLQYDSFDVFFCVAVLLAMTVIYVVLGISVFWYRYVRLGARKLKRNTGSEKFKAIEASWRGDVKGILMRRDILRDAAGKDAADETTQVGTAVDQIINASKLKKQGSTKEDMSPNINQRSPEKEKRAIANSNASDPPLLEKDQRNIVSESDRIWCFGINSMFVQINLSRIFLVVIFIADFFATSLICFQPETRTTFEEPGKDINVDLSFQNVATDSLFLAVNVVFFFIYGVQFWVQALFLSPYHVSGICNFFFHIIKFSWCNTVRISKYDIFAIFMITLDGFLIITLLFQAVDQIFALVISIRLVRFLRVIFFWAKVSVFHEVRALAFLAAKEEKMAEYEYNQPDAPDYGEGDNNMDDVETNTDDNSNTGVGSRMSLFSKRTGQNSDAVPPPIPPRIPARPGIVMLPQSMLLGTGLGGAQPLFLQTSIERGNKPPSIPQNKPPSIPQNKPPSLHSNNNSLGQSVPAGFGNFGAAAWIPTQTSVERNAAANRVSIGTGPGAFLKKGATRLERARQDKGVQMAQRQQQQRQIPPMPLVMVSNRAPPVPFQPAMPIRSPGGVPAPIITTNRAPPPPPNVNPDEV